MPLAFGRAIQPRDIHGGPSFAGITLLDIDHALRYPDAVRLLRDR
jgi:hypothetical protein